MCRLLGLSLSTAFYRKRRSPDADLRLIERMKELVEQYPRYGLRMLHRILVAEGLVVNIKRTARLYKQLCLQLVNRRKRQRKHQPKSRGQKPKAARAHHRWAIDFVHDSLADGRRLRMLAAIDEYTRQSVCLGVDLRIDGFKASAMLDEAAAIYGCYPAEIICDNGTEFTGKWFGQWAIARGVKLRFIDRGKPSQNAYVESYNGRLRDECLSINCFLSLPMAQAVIGRWRNQYNNQRPHSGLGGMTPAQFASKQVIASAQPLCA